MTDGRSTVERTLEDCDCGIEQPWDDDDEDVAGSVAVTAAAELMSALADDDGELRDWRGKIGDEDDGELREWRGKVGEGLSDDILFTADK